MSRETSEWLNTMVLVGFTEKRGHAWHYRKSDQADESNHYPNEIPVPDVERRLFSWEPVLTPVQYEFNGELLTTDDFIVAIDGDSGSVKGVHGSDYQAHSYRQWLLESVSEILDDDLKIGSAGLLKDSKVAYVTVEVPDNFTTPEGVEFRPNLLATTSLDGSIATTFKRIVTDVVCDNTRSAALREKGQEFKVKHTKNSHLRLTDAREALAIVHTMADDFAAEVKALCETKVSEGDWAKFLDELVPVPEPEMARKEKSDELIVLNKRGITSAENKRSDLTSMYHSDPRCEAWKGTAYGVVQTVNTWQTHESIVRGQDRFHKNMLATIQGKYDELDGNTIETLNKVLAA